MFWNVLAFSTQKNCVPRDFIRPGTDGKKKKAQIALVLDSGWSSSVKSCVHFILQYLNLKTFAHQNKTVKALGLSRQSAVKLITMRPVRLGGVVTRHRRRREAAGLVRPPSRSASRPSFGCGRAREQRNMSRPIRAHIFHRTAVPKAN